MAREPKHPPKRHFFPDEEPESDFPWFSYESYSGMCGFCGHDDHDAEHCPVRPQRGGG